jgi:hypothetical protein
VRVPPTVVLGGFTFWTFSGASAEVYTETTIGATGTQAVVVQIDADVSQIEKDYARSYAGRPAIYALGSSATFFRAIQTIGGSTTTTPTWATGLCICHAPHPDWLFVNWEAEKNTTQLTTIRHELTHVMEHQMIPSNLSSFPAWFDEGNAVVEEFTIANTQWWAAMERYRAASIASQNSNPFGLFELISPSAWSQQSELNATYEYALASQAVTILRSDIGMRGELLMFDLMMQGQSFFDSYDLASGRTYLDFQAEFLARVRALAPQSPGVATAVDSPAGPGLTFMAYGLPPNALVTYSISGTSSSNTISRAADAYGFLYTYIDNAWPAGSYTMTVNWSGGSVSGSGVKAN